MSLSIISVVFGAKPRQKDLSCDQHNSIGLKSGEDGDKQRTFAPTALIMGSIDASLSAGISITTTTFDHN
jgi:hypothetical protein